MSATEPAAAPIVPRLPSACYLVIGRDGPDVAALRAQHLDGHLAHVETHWTRYITAGPMREPGGEALVGSVYLVLAESLADAVTLMQADPYVASGLYASLEYKEFTNAVGLYLGGRIWASRDALRHMAAGGPAAGLTKGVAG